MITQLTIEQLPQSGEYWLLEIAVRTSHNLHRIPLGKLAEKVSVYKCLGQYLNIGQDGNKLTSIDYDKISHFELSDDKVLTIWLK